MRGAGESREGNKGEESVIFSNITQLLYSQWVLKFVLNDEQ